MIFNLSFKHKIPDDAIVIDITSNSSDPMGRALSPFNIGPVDLYDGYWAYNIENAFQFSRVYPIHNFDETPSQAYFDWAVKGWQTRKAIKYPFGAWNIPLFSWWNGKKLSRLEAQNNIFLPLYSKAVVKTRSFQKLKDIYNSSDKDIVLLDYEGYNHRDLEMNWNDVVNHPTWPIGQGFVISMILEGFVSV